MKKILKPTPKYFRLYDKDGKHIADVPYDPQHELLLVGEYDMTYLGMTDKHIKYKIELL